jgi:hypothetical protein
VYFLKELLRKFALVNMSEGILIKPAHILEFLKKMGKFFCSTRGQNCKLFHCFNESEEWGTVALKIG